MRAIADGEQEYRLIAPEVRRESLTYLGRMVGDSVLKIDLIVVSDDGARLLKKALRDYDSLSVFGSGFTLWGYHSGSVAGSEHHSYVRPHRKLLDELHAHTIAKGPVELSTLLSELANRP